MKNIIILLSLLILSACANNPNRAGCTYIDGKGRYGTFTQYAKGDAKGAHVYVGKNIKGVTITCTKDEQEVKIK